VRCTIRGVRDRPPFALAAMSAALAACTYDVPGLLSRHDDAGSRLYEGDLAPPDGAAPDADACATGNGAGGAPPGADGLSPVDATCTDILDPCDNGSDCASHICARALTVGRPLHAAAGGIDFCTRPCCTSEDCAPGTVCFASGQGGDYCVDPAWLGRSAPGRGLGGAPCTAGTECRSGLCAAGACADTCCSAVAPHECALGAVCAFGAFPGRVTFDTHFAGRCGPAPSGSGDAGDVGAPCRSPSDCPAGDGCLLYEQGVDLAAVCQPSDGARAQGATCSPGGGAACAGGWCSAHGRCTGICFSDGDCMAGWRCTPQLDSLPTGNYLVLGCGP
jgi:hypothetical protein